MAKKNTIAVAPANTYVAEVLPPASAVEQALQKYGLSNYSYESRLSYGRHLVFSMAENAYAIGLVLMDIKNHEQHGRYTQAVESIGFQERTARMYAARSKWILESGKSAIFAVLSGSKIAPLMALPGSMASDLVDQDGNIAGLAAAEIESMTAAEFAEEIANRTEALIEARTSEKAALGKAKTWETKFDTEREKYEKLQGQLLHKAEIARLPEFAVTMRQEAVAQCDQIDLCLDTLDQVYREKLRPQFQGALGHYAVQAAGTYYYALRGVLARVQAAVQALGETVGDDVTGPFRQEFTLNKGELALAQETYELVKRRHEALTHNKLVRRRREKSVRGRHGDEIEVP